MADFSSQMENAYRKHFDAKSEIRVKENTGKFLYKAAWVVEIIAVLTGFAIAFSTPLVTYGEIENPDLRDKLMLFQGTLPLFAIAVVEATKIPLAQGFYMSQILKWKLLFLISLILLIGVTFETMFNGLENYFSFTTNQIIEEETTIQDKSLVVKDLEEQIIELDKEKEQLENLDESSISQTFSKSISADNQARRNELKPLEEESEKIREDYNLSIQNLEAKVSALRKEADMDPRIVQKNKTLSKLRQDQNNLIDLVNKEFSAQIKNLERRREQENEKIKAASEQKGLFKGQKDIIEPAQKNIIEIDAQIDAIQNNKTAEIKAKNLNIENDIKKLTEEINLLTSRLISASKTQIDSYEKEIQELRNEKQDRLQSIKNEISIINRKYNETTTQTNSLKTKRLQTIDQRKERIPEIEKEKNKLLIDIEKNKKIIREAKKAKRERIQESNIYRMTNMWMKPKCEKPTFEVENGKRVEKCPDGIFLPKDIANVTQKDTQFFATLWFGSISLVVALIGVMLAMASFVIRDEENFKAQKPKFLFNSFRRLITSFSLLLRKFGTLFIIIGKAITNFFDGLTHIFDRRIRDGIRRAIIGVRKKAREPKIKTVEVTKEVVVEKEIEVPVEKEKIVFKEVPKEVIRREMIHVPLYSTEHGKVDLDSMKLGEAATDNFTKAQSESIKTTKDASVKKQSKGQKKPVNKSTKKK